MGRRTTSPAAIPAQGQRLRTAARGTSSSAGASSWLPPLRAIEAYAQSSATTSSKPDTFEAQAIPARSPAPRKATAERVLRGVDSRPMPAHSSAPSHAIASKRSGVSAKSPTAVSGTTARIKPASARAAPQGAELPRGHVREPGHQGGEERRDEMGTQRARNCAFADDPEGHADEPGMIEVGRLRMSGPRRVQRLAVSEATCEAA